ncbi:hypothetical protein OVZ07_03385, partial [Salmonella enterica subsp. enterica serovar 1,4,[5],12:i:-]|nr:hypothetical protein [Salmonella enterica subsp. enterica serovar 1,4,[5],12:i:-]MCY4958346.1 hypothetical protein [Salmonella enterica subsp. enterica serovar 1,4,[5],12:i:-]
LVYCKMSVGSTHHLEMVFVWKQNYILVDEYFFFCCTWIVNSAILLVALCLSVGMRFYSKLMPVICFTQLSWVRRHCFTIVMLGFIIYFFIFSFFVGIYKPQLKKEYEMILYDGGWYYVLARYHDSFILSKSFTKNNNRFIIFRPEDGHSYEITLVKVRL